MDSDEVISVKKLAEDAGVTVAAVKRWIRLGRVVAVPLSREHYDKHVVPIAEAKRVIKNVKRGLPVDFGLDKLATA